MSNRIFVTSVFNLKWLNWIKFFDYSGSLTITAVFSCWTPRISSPSLWARDIALGRVWQSRSSIYFLLGFCTGIELQCINVSYVKLFIHDKGTNCRVLRPRYPATVSIQTTPTGDSSDTRRNTSCCLRSDHEEIIINMSDFYEIQFALNFGFSRRR